MKLTSLLPRRLFSCPEGEDPKGEKKMAQHELWRIGSDGLLSAESGNLRLVVRKAEGCARFLVLKNPADAESHPAFVLASGTESDVHAAMAAAERMLARFEPCPGA